MNPTERSSKLALAGGIVLVVVGSAMLMDDFMWPVIEPIRDVLVALAAVAWPLALVLAGVALLVRARGGGAISIGGRQLLRSRTDRVATGLLGGIAEATQVSSAIVRAVFIAIVVLGGGLGAILLYVVATLLVPDAAPFAAASASAAPAPPAPPAP